MRRWPTRLARRQERGVPVLARIKAWLDAESEIVLPRWPPRRSRSNFAALLNLAVLLN